MRTDNYSPYRADTARKCPARVQAISFRRHTPGRGHGTAPAAKATGAVPCRGAQRREDAFDLADADRVDAAERVAAGLVRVVTNLYRSPR